MHSSAMPTVSAFFSGPVSVGLLAGVVSGLFYLVVAGIRWAGEVKQQSEEWLYRQVQRRLHPTSSDRRLCTIDNGVGMEPEAVRVREFIERLVESLVSGELDNVCIKRLHSHPEYKHMADQDSPSAAHAALKQLVHQIIQEAMTLPKFKGVIPTDDDMKSLEDMESKTYEDILATAILNKVIERYQQRESSDRTGLDGNSNHLSPELMSLVAMHQPRLLSNSESGVSHLRSADDGRYLINDYDSFSELSNTDPLSVTIEECIEEVTTFSNADEEEDADDPESYLPGLDVFKNRRAPFPEYGRDIVDGPPLDISDSEEDDAEVASDDETSMQPTDIINPVDSWEENWLFQKRRLKVGGVPQPMPVPMLVPNPSEDYRALIGDRDAEDVSDLSDCSDGALEDMVLAEDNISTSVSEIIPSSALDTKEKIVISSVDNKIISPKVVDESIKNSETASEHLNKTDAIPQDDDKETTYDELTEAKNMEYIKSAADDCLSEFGQQEGEYTEDYAAVTQRQMDSLTAISDPDAAEIPELPSSPIPQMSPETSTVDESVIAILEGLVPGESDTANTSTPSVGTTELAKPPRPGTENLDDEYCTLPVAGTIAEREHKKWETAPPIPNNPYSSENIIKRLNKKHPYNRTSSSSDASLEFLESKETPVAEKIVDQPLQVICSPSDVDFRRYGRDYYINAQPVANGKIKQSSTSPSQHQNLTQANDTEIASALIDDPSKVVEGPLETDDSNHIETKVALWQKEINEADQYYKNVLNKSQEHLQDIPSSDNDYLTDTSFYKSALSNGNGHHDNDTNENIKPKSKNKIRDRIKEFEKIDGHGLDTNEEKLDSLIKVKSDLRMKKTDTMFEPLGMLRRNNNMGSTFSLNENGNDVYTNGYARSDSPSGSSVLTSDSDCLPSVRELTKRFSVVVDSDSSTSSPKSVSPAPQWGKRDQLPKKEKDETKVEPHGITSNLNPPRPVREIHSLTARSISKEFREELRHNQPVPLNKNVYKQINPKFSNGLNNGIAEESSVPGDTSISSAPKSPLPHRSMQSSIAFWEQMQKKS